MPNKLSYVDAFFRYQFIVSMKEKYDEDTNLTIWLPFYHVKRVKEDDKIRDELWKIRGKGRENKTNLERK